jgi:hypothetical protein
MDTEKDQPSPSLGARPGDAPAARRGQLHDAMRDACAALAPLLRLAARASWQLVRLPLCALLVLIEPLLRATLVPLAFLGFLVTLVFGFLLGDPRFPKWGMLAGSVAALCLYWLYLGLLSLFMSLPDERH